MRGIKIICVVMCALTFSACVTTPEPSPEPVPKPPITDQDGNEGEIIPPVIPRDVPPVHDGKTEIGRPAPPPPKAEIITDPDAFYDSAIFMNADPRPAIAALSRSCALFDPRDDAAALHNRHSLYGIYEDWREACFAIDYVQDDAPAARAFLKRFFTPVNLSSEGETGLLTGYYEPEIPARLRPSPEFSEPILGVPFKEEDRTKPRAEIGPAMAPLIGFGRPIDVFFMQIQGSGQLVFEDGQRMRAAFAAHNGRPYVSIGKVLVARGELTLEEASKQSIEAWMAKNGPAATRALMNENPRYVFFKTEAVPAGEGPKGAQTVPLTAMGSIAIDPSYHPYGVPVFLETTLPAFDGDYTGRPAALLVIAQDTGGAIKGPLRADLFFGSGDDAGARAGVMKHPARWTVLLPHKAAERLAPGS